MTVNDLYKIQQSLGIEDENLSKTFEYASRNGVMRTLAMLRKMEEWYTYSNFVLIIKHLYSLNPDNPLTKTIPKEVASLLKYKTYLIKFITQDMKSTEGGNFSRQIEATRQFMMSIKNIVSKETPHYVLGIIKPPGTNNLDFFISVPKARADVVEHNSGAIFHNAKIVDADTPNISSEIFKSEGHNSGAYMQLKKFDGIPLAQYNQMQSDPINVILNTLFDLDTKDGALIQIVVNPLEEKNEEYKKIISKLKKGKKLKDVLKGKKGIDASKLFTEAGKEFFGMVKDIKISQGDSDKKDSSPDKDKKDEKKKEEDREEAQNDANLISEKIKDYTASTDIYIVSYSENSSDMSKDILTNISTAFDQYANPEGNQFKLEKNDEDVFENSIWGAYDKNMSIVLNYKEIAQIFHIPDFSGDTSIKTSMAPKELPCPANIPTVGTVVGINSYRNTQKYVRIADEDRLRHMYIVGQTGTGKTGSLLTMIAQDIQNGKGVAYIDPHGSDIQKIFAFIPPERYEDVIYFDISMLDYPLGLNMLEYDRRRPHTKSLVVDELFNIFQTLYSAETMGPAFQQYFKNTARLAIEGMDSPTLLEISRILGNSTMRNELLEKDIPADLKEFWSAALKVKGEQQFENFYPYITSKIDPMINNDILRYIILQKKSFMNFRDIMDQRKILLISIPKGLVGEINQKVIGMIIVGKFQIAAMSRADDPLNSQFPQFNLYIDEVQNFVTPSIESILAEARKYKLSLTIANQYIQQLDEKIKNAVLGNVGNICVFRVSPDTASVMQRIFHPYITEADLVGQPARHAYARVLVKGQPTNPFNMRTIDYRKLMFFDPEENIELVNQIKLYSVKRYGRHREEVMKEINERYEEFKAEKPSSNKGGGSILDMFS